MERQKHHVHSILLYQHVSGSLNIQRVQIEGEDDRKVRENQETGTDENVKITGRSADEG